MKSRTGKLGKASEGKVEGALETKACFAKNFDERQKKNVI